MAKWDTTLTPAVPLLLMPHLRVTAHPCELHVEIERWAGRKFAWISPILGQEIPEGDPEAGGEQADTSAGETAVEAVIEAAKLLGLPVRDVLVAASIAHRTFYSWRGSSVSPRLASQGQLWALVQAVSDLREIMEDDLPLWIAADPHRREALLAGDFDALMGEILERKAQSGEYSRSLVGIDMMDAVGPEYPDVPDVKPQRLSGKVAKAKSGTRVRGKDRPR